MPWALIWMALVLALAAVALAAGDRRRAWGLLAVFAALPTTFILYNLSPTGPLWAGMLWATFPVFVLYQWLNLRLPAILGEATALPYVAYAFGWVPEWPAQATADVLGLAMVASLGGPGIAILVSRAVASVAGSRHRAVGVRRDSAG